MNSVSRRLIWGWFCILVLCCSSAFALEPNEVLVIANSDIESSVKIAQYYCAKRNVPTDNILSLSLGKTPNDLITRENYEKQLVEPIRKKLSDYEFAVKIRCLLTTYGVPIKVGKRGPLKDQQGQLEKLKKLVKQEKSKIESLKQDSIADVSKEIKKSERILSRLQILIDCITGKETNASVDSELSMVLCGEYELCRWQPNRLKNNLPGLYSNTLMVSRLDGPSFEIAKGLIDKAIKAEKKGLKGIIYIDSRGIAEDKNPYSFGSVDQSLRDLAAIAGLQTRLAVKEERTEKLFGHGSCPRAAVYCGWYSLKKYVDAFDFVDGAVGFHISSLEAVDLRDPNSSQWCPAMLKDGITATLGAVAEPYLHSFPRPKEFFSELFSGRCLAEAYYITKPFNSWQLVLIGDPLYTPFKSNKKYQGDNF
jgi:uncharacterized protein (TIGR03790 family)